MKTKSSRLQRRLEDRWKMENSAGVQRNPNASPGGGTLLMSNAGLQIKNKSKTSRTNHKRPPGFALHPVVRIRRTSEDISNDISEGMPLTQAEVLRVLKLERRRTFDLENTINRLRDVMVRVGLMLATDQKYYQRHTELIITISRALKYPNEKGQL